MSPRRGYTPGELAGLIIGFGVCALLMIGSLVNSVPAK